MTDTTPTPPPARPFPLITFVLVPLLVAGVAYTWDLAFAAGDVMIPDGGRVEVQRYAVVTAVFCLIEAIVGATLLVRRHQTATATALVAYLVALAVFVLWLGSFRG